MELYLQMQDSFQGPQGRTWGSFSDKKLDPYLVRRHSPV